MKSITILIGILLASLSMPTLANALNSKDITGVWNQIDDKTGTPKAIIEIRKEGDSYTGTIQKVNARPGYKPKEICVNCPAPYTNKPILGLDVLTGIKKINQNTFAHGKIIDPLSGNIYSAQIKLSSNGKRLSLKAFVKGLSTLGRSQVWLRAE